MKNIKSAFEIIKYDNEAFEYKIAAENHFIIKIPKENLRELDNDIYQKINTHFIYFLINKKNKKIYVGRSNIRKCDSPARLFEHERNKSWWDEVLVYPNNEMEENISIIVESHFINLLKNSIYELDNKNNGGKDLSNITFTNLKAKKHIEDIKKLIIIPIYDIFWQKEDMKNVCCINKNYDYELSIDSENNEISKNNIYEDQFNNFNDDNKNIKYPEFYFNRSGYKATMVMISDKEYILKNGSEISENLLPSGSDTIKKRREKNKCYIENYRLIKDIKFSSPSAAAEFVCGGNASGNEAWKEKSSGKSPKYFKK